MAVITFQGTPLHTNGELPQVGSHAPDFLLTNKELSDVNLASFKGKKLLLNIFPSLDTGTCAKSVKNFYEKAKHASGFLVLNISCDLPFAQQRFCDAHALSFVQFLSAFRSSFPRDYGLQIAEGPLKGLCSRVVLVIDQEGKVVYREQVAELTHEPNYEKALEAVLGL